MRTLGHCCSHGRDMTGSKSALRLCSCITEVWTACIVSESLLTSSQRIGMPDASLLFYNAQENLKNWRSPFFNFILWVISTEKAGKYTVYLTTPWKHLVVTYMEYYRSTSCHFFHNFYYLNYNSIGSVSSPLCVWILERVCSQTQLCQLRCFNDYNSIVIKTS